MIANTTLDLQQRITARVLEMVPRSRVVWRRDYESDCGWVVIILDLDRSQFSQAKSAIREFRPEAERLGIDILPMVKDVETSQRYYPRATVGVLDAAWTAEIRNDDEGDVAAAGWVLAFGEMACRDLGTVADESLKILPCASDSALPWPTLHLRGSFAMRPERGVAVAPGQGGNKGVEPTAMGVMTENEDLALAA
jgi:hypothetical protein